MKEFRLIIAGGRDFNDYFLLSKELTLLANITLADKAVSIVSGMAKGADSVAVRFAKENNVRLYEFPARWYPNGVLDRGAGHKRNRQMGDFADGLLAFWDGRSPGTNGMIEYMQRLKKPVHVVSY
jgi:hypothetical protein